MKKLTNTISWVLALFVGLVVFVPSLFFKFGGAAESRHIFQTVGDFLGIGFFEPYGRYVIGMAELTASVLLIVPRMQIYGAILGLGVLSGAIFFHLFSPLGIVVRWVENGTAQQDSTLFILAVLSFLSLSAIIWMRREALIWLVGKEEITKQEITHDVS